LLEAGTRRIVMNAPQKPDIVMPSPHEKELATQSSRILSRLKHEELSVQVDGERLVLPKAVVSLLSKILTEMSLGNAVTIMPIHAELTTQEAAEFLNVSRPYLVNLLESGAIAFTKVGTHRRVKFLDLQEYKRKKDAESDAALAELTRQAQELDMGY
jgi:excisionase family DNA binding protein